MHRLLIVLAVVGAGALGQVPELMWLKFDEGGGTVTANSAAPATAVGNLSAPLTGHELTPGLGCGGSGALRGFGGHTNYVETGWQPNIAPGAPWSLGFVADWSAVNTPIPLSYSPYILLATSYDASIGPSVQCTFGFGPGGWSLKLGRTDGTFGADTHPITTPGRHVIIWVYDPPTAHVNVYVDGVQTASNGLGQFAPGLSSAAATSLRIGGRGAVNSPYEHGMPYDFVIDDFRIYNHALSAAEIAAWVAICPTWTSFVPPPPPANDLCTAPITVGLGLNGPFTTKYATNSIGFNSCSYGDQDADVWFAFTPPETGVYGIKTCAPVVPLDYLQHHATTLSVHTSSCGLIPNTCAEANCGTLATFESGGYLASITDGVPMNAGTLYKIRVANYVDYWRGIFYLTIVPPAVNEACAAAIPLPMNGTVAGSNQYTSTAPATFPSCIAWYYTASRHVWYSYKYEGACANVTTTLSLCAGYQFLFDPLMVVYAGSCGSLLEVACGDDECPTLGGYGVPIVTFHPTPGVKYLVGVFSHGTDPGGDFALTATTTPGVLQSTSVGCGGNIPILTANLPQIGQAFNLQVNSGGTSTGAYLLVAATFGPPTTLPGGCHVLLDPAGITAIPMIMGPQSGFWSLSFPIPNAPQFACVSGDLQAVILASGGLFRTSQVLQFKIGG